MDPYASEQFLVRDLSRLVARASREGWEIHRNGLLVEAILVQRKTAQRFRLLLVCDGYPQSPMAASFLPMVGTGAASKWPVDGEHAFRSQTVIPFICLPGLLSYSPEGDQTTNPYSRHDLRVGAVLGRVADAINSEQCAGFTLRGPGF